MYEFNMNMKRFKQLLAAYGANVERWPDEERDEAARFVETNQQAKTLLSEEALFDEALDAWQVEPLYDARDKTLARLGNNADRNLADRFVDWLLPDLDHAGARLWRPALLAGIALTLGIALGSTVSLESNNEADVWQEELHVMALNTEQMEAAR